MSKNIDINRIRLDGGTQSRAELCSDAIDDYAEALTEGEQLPPCDVFHDGKDYWMGDGFHRYHAHKKADFRTINVTIHQGTVEDARWFSCAANKGQDKTGLRRTNADKRRQVETALRLPQSAKMSDNQIADYVGVSQKTVNNYRRSLSNLLSEPKPTTRTCKDGREMDVSNIGKTPTLRTLAHEIGEDDKPPTPTKQYINGDTGEEIENLVTVTTKTTRGTFDDASTIIAACRQMEGVADSLKGLRPKKNMSIEAADSIRAVIEKLTRLIAAIEKD